MSSACKNRSQFVLRPIDEEADRKAFLGVFVIGAELGGILHEKTYGWAQMECSTGINKVDPGRRSERQFPILLSHVVGR